MAWTFSPYALKRMTEDDKGRRIREVRYQAKTDSPTTEGDVSLRTAFNLAYPYGSTTYSLNGESDTSCIRTRPIAIVPSRSAGNGTFSQWFIDATFDSGGDRHCSNESFEGAPWTHPWTLRFVTQRIMEIVETDKDGDELLNYADEPYNPAIEVGKPYPSILLQGNASSLNLLSIGEALKRGGSVNQSAIGLFGARTLRMAQFDFDELYWGTCQSYYSCTIALEINPDTWDLEITQSAYRTVNLPIGSDPQYTRIDQALPVPIDAQGQEIEKPNPPITRTHRIHPEIDFSTVIPANGMAKIP